MTAHRIALDRQLRTLLFPQGEPTLHIGTSKKNVKWYVAPHDKTFDLDDSDFKGDITKAPPRELHGAFGRVTMIEILEHVPPDNHIDVWRHAHMMLTKGGQIIASWPFAYPYHPDPIDCSRPTGAWEANVAERAGFVVEKILPYGGPGTVAWGAIRHRYGKNRVVSAVLRIFDSFFGRRHDPTYPSGWILIARKDDGIKK